MRRQHDADVVIELDIVILRSAVEPHVTTVGSLEINHDVLGFVDWSFELHTVDFVHVNATLLHLSLN